MLYCTLAVVHALSCRVILGGSDVDQSTVVPPTVPSYAATIITTSTSLFRSVCARRALLARVVGILVIPVWSRYATSLLTRGFPGRVHLRLNNLFTCRVALTRIVSRVLAARIALPAVAYISPCLVPIGLSRFSLAYPWFPYIGDIEVASDRRAGVDLFVLCPEEDQLVWET
jgi:hypothetical protein